MNDQNLDPQNFDSLTTCGDQDMDYERYNSCDDPFPWIRPTVHDVRFLCSDECFEFDLEKHIRQGGWIGDYHRVIYPENLPTDGVACSICGRTVRPDDFGPFE